MRNVRVLALCVLLVIAPACTGDEPRTAASGRPATESSRASGPSEARARDARMSVGTDSEPGTLVAWCADGDCKRYPGAKPPRYVRGVESGLLLFQIGARPVAARVVVRGRSSDVAARGTLHPSSTMAFRADLPAGRYVVTLVAQWPDREARWVFGMLGPAGSEFTPPTR